MEFLKEKKGRLYLLGFFLIGCAIFTYVLKAGSVSIPISYNQHAFPVIEAKIENVTYPLEVRIGSRFPLFLPKKILSNIKNKSFCGLKEWKSLEGFTHQASCYIIPSIEIAGLRLKNIPAIQTEEDIGILGQYLGGDGDLYVDFPKSRLIASPSFPKALYQLFNQNSWVKVPLKKSIAGLIIQVETDRGTYNLSLNTTCTETTIKNSLLGEQKPLFSSTFSIEGQEFGGLFLHPGKIPDALSEIDGFIGMDFLKKTTLYLDHKQEVAYIKKPRRYLERFSAIFNSYNMPLIPMECEQKTYLIGLDLGSSYLFSLKEDLLRKIKKRKTEKLRGKILKEESTNLFPIQFLKLD